MTDIRYAVRTFLRTPAFTIIAIVTLALGIGATTTIFSVVNAVLLKPLPYRGADRLVSMRGSLPDFRDVEASSRSFDGVAIWASNLYNLRTDADARQVLGGVVSRTLMPLLGVEMVVGRNFTEEDDRLDTVILGYGLSQSSFGGDSSVLGRAISAQLARSYPSTNAGVAISVQMLYDRLVGDVKPALTILLGIVGLLLLIACANVANLMLSRTTVREREMAPDCPPNRHSYFATPQPFRPPLRGNGHVRVGWCCDRDERFEHVLNRDA